MEGMPPDNGYLLPPFECSNQDSENAKTSLLSCLHINAASVFTMLAAFYFLPLTGACIGKKAHCNRTDRWTAL